MGKRTEATSPERAGSSLGWVIAASRRAGLDVPALLAEAGVDPAAAADPEALVPLERVLELRRLAEQRSRDPAFALHAGERLVAGDLGLVDYVFESSASPAEVLASLSRYYRLVAHGNMQLELRLDADAATMVARMLGPVPDALRWVERQSVEFTFSATTSRLRAGFAGGLSPRQAAFRHARPAWGGEYERIFGCPLAFDAPENVLVFAQEQLSLPNPRSDGRLHQLLRGFADSILARLPAPAGVAGRVLGALQRELQGGSPAVDAVARTLGMTRRTLHRRLAEEGTSFAALRDSLRKELAQVYLRDPSLTLGDVSYLLGFSQPSAFHRAFKRWTGKPPLAFRARC